MLVSTVKAMDRVNRILLDILSAGPVPKHVAFVMDGNRRYARIRKWSVQDGHREGFLALKRVRLSVFDGISLSPNEVPMPRCLKYVSGSASSA